MVELYMECAQATNINKLEAVQKNAICLVYRQLDRYFPHPVTFSLNYQCLLNLHYRGLKAGLVCYGLH